MFYKDNDKQQTSNTPLTYQIHELDYSELASTLDTKIMFHFYVYTVSQRSTKDMPTFIFAPFFHIACKQAISVPVFKYFIKCKSLVRTIQKFWIEIRTIFD